MEAAHLRLEMKIILVLCLLWPFLLGAVTASSDANEPSTRDDGNCDNPELIVSSMKKQNGYRLIISKSTRSLGFLPVLMTTHRKLAPTASGVVITIPYTSHLSVGCLGAGKAGQGTNYVCSATRTLKRWQQKVTYHQAGGIEDGYHSYVLHVQSNADATKARGLSII
ncbi:hypothetical protein ACP70R_015511 [Stipagrostis hirtigluma subsp. patula]